MSAMKILKPKAKKIFVGLAALVAAFLLIFLTYAHTPIDQQKRTSLVEIPKGTGFVKIVDILQEKGLVKYRPLFYLLAILKGSARQIRAGEYEFVSNMTPADIINKLVRGQIKEYRITISEDISLREIAAKLAEYKLTTERNFLDAAFDPSLLASLDINAASAEGYLYPDTYRFDRTMNPSEMIKIMVSRFRKKVTSDMIEKAQQLGFTEAQFVTLASLIGKESGNREEKTLISAVFHNRLKKKMRLQCDPTAVYDLWSFSGTIKRSHLRRNSPYNTYVIDGLPPGPIANPGLDSFEAAINPANVSYLYFVSQNDGTHYFSSNLSDHNEASAKFQTLKRK